MGLFPNAAGPGESSAGDGDDEVNDHDDHNGQDDIELDVLPKHWPCQISWRTSKWDRLQKTQTKRKCDITEIIIRTYP